MNYYIKARREYYGKDNVTPKDIALIRMDAEAIFRTNDKYYLIEILERV